MRAQFFTDKFKFLKNTSFKGFSLNFILCDDQKHRKTGDKVHVHKKSFYFLLNKYDAIFSIIEMDK